MLDVDRIKKESTGKWKSIMDNLGIEVGDGKHCPCPQCGGEDRFRFDNKEGRGTWICNQHGSGDGFSLIQQILGCTFIEACQKVSDILGICSHDEPDKQMPDAKKMLIELWQASTKLTGSDQVSQYLHSRGIALTPDDVRLCPKCWNSDTKCDMVAMIALIKNKAGKGISIHRTYLDGPKKADVPKPKKIMPGTEKLAGSAIRLSPAVEHIGIAEGIETAMSAYQLTGIPTWAATSAGLMEAWEPPEEVRKITIFADNDPGFSGQAAAYRLAKKLYYAPYERIVDVQLPSLGDFNEELNL